jgi:proteasome accessory factor A
MTGQVPSQRVARYLFRRVVSWGRSINVFLRNGARLYLDVGSHPEYATPECDNVLDLVAHDKAGERILEGLLVDADRRLREEGQDTVWLGRSNQIMRCARIGRPEHNPSGTFFE